MADNADFTRLTELLLGRQDQQQQQLDRLAAIAEAQTETNRQLADADRRLEVSLAKTDEILSTFGQVQIRVLDEMEKLRIEQVRANRVQEQYAKRQEEYAKRQEEYAKRQEEYAKRQDEYAQRQEEYAKRQDDFNVIFLEEIRGLKQEARSTKDTIVTTVQEHEERLRRLEDFMNGFQSAA